VLSILFVGNRCPPVFPFASTGRRCLPQSFSTSGILDICEMHNQEPLLPCVQTKTPVKTLVRVRNNQRRHRERRRHYIASLEQKAQETESLLEKARAEVADLRAEMRRCKCTRREEDAQYASKWERLNIDEKGGKPRYLDEHPLPATRYNSSNALSATALQTNTVTIRFQENRETQESNDYGNDIPSKDLSSKVLASSPSPLLDSSPCCDYDTSSPAAEVTALSINSSYDGFPASPANCNNYPPVLDESTTLCSKAYALIAQQNFRGLDTSTLRNWLESGFRRGKSQNEGCRVQNPLLFSLLDFISGA
jgi:hypothetical protein